MRISDWSSDVCSSDPQMTGPFELPADIRAGDYIEIGMLGAYGAAMRTAFNGFGPDETVEVTDEPLASLYFERADRKSAVEGKSVHVRVGLGGRRIIKEKKCSNHNRHTHLQTRH